MGNGVEIENTNKAAHSYGEKTRIRPGSTRVMRMRAGPGAAPSLHWPITGWELSAVSSGGRMTTNERPGSWWDDPVLWGAGLIIAPGGGGPGPGLGADSLWQDAAPAQWILLSVISPSRLIKPLSRSVTRLEHYWISTFQSSCRWNRAPNIFSENQGWLLLWEPSWSSARLWDRDLVARDIDNWYNHLDWK